MTTELQIAVASWGIVGFAWVVNWSDCGHWACLGGRVCGPPGVGSSSGLDERLYGQRASPQES